MRLVLLDIRDTTIGKTMVEGMLEKSRRTKKWNKSRTKI